MNIPVGMPKILRRDSWQPSKFAGDRLDDQGSDTG
jgi:hypothetical protein